MTRGAIRAVSLVLALLVLLPAAPALAGPLTWLSPRNVDGSGQVTAISCPSITLCVAVDSSGNVVTSRRPFDPAAAWTVTHIESDQILGVSCWSTTHCVAVDRGGNVLISANPTGGAAAWSSTHVASGRLDGVSCPTEFLCVAIDHTGQNAVTSDNGSWPPGHWNTTHLDAIPRAVSCASATLCVIAADFGWEITSTNPVAGAWTARNVEAPFPSDYPLDGVSCTPPALCVADDNAGNVLTSNPTTTTSAWGLSQVDNENWMNGVSCASPSLCVAVDSDGDVLTSTDPTGGSAAWEVTNVDGGNIIFAVSCASTLLCVAADWNGNVIVGAALPVSSSAPAISGAAVQGQTLTAQRGAWTNRPTGFTYGWLRCDGSGRNCGPIAGATNQSYTVTAADIGSTLRVAEVASNDLGSGTAARSLATSVVSPAPVDCPAVSRTDGAAVGVTVQAAAKYVNRANVVLTIVPPDAATSVLISNDGGFTQPTLAPVQPPYHYPWTLASSGPERLPKTVYLRFVGPCVDPSQTFQDDIILDETPPRIAKATVSAPRKGRGPAQLRLKATDNASGLARVQVRRAHAKIFAAKFRSKVRLTGAPRRVSVRVQDGAGNYSRWRTAKILKGRRR